MQQFRRLMQVVLVAGAISGFLLFVLQNFTVVPLIYEAETYEEAARPPAAEPGHDNQAWQPETGFERTTYTALGTTLTGIGFAGMLFGSAAFANMFLSARRGALLGLFGFVCFTLAPAIGLPPKPPGAAVADLQSRQLWWIATAMATAMGLLLIFRRKSRVALCAGILCLLLPHFAGAPAASEVSAVPAGLIRWFALGSVLTDGIFWVVLGTVGGFLYNRFDNQSRYSAARTL